MMKQLRLRESWHYFALVSLIVVILALTIYFLQLRPASSYTLNSSQLFGSAIIVLGVFTAATIIAITNKLVVGVSLVYLSLTLGLTAWYH